MIMKFKLTFLHYQLVHDYLRRIGNLQAKIPKNKFGSKNTETVIASIDLPLIFMKVAGSKQDTGVDYDGECMYKAIAGKVQEKRNKSLMQIRSPDRPGYAPNNDLDLAIREGDYKLLMDFDGANIQLYKLLDDMGEANNLKDTKTEKVLELKKEREDWFEKYPHDIDLEKYSFDLIRE